MGRRGENSAEGPRLVQLKAEDRHGFPVPSSCPHSVGEASSPQGKTGSLQGEVKVILPSFQVFHFKLPAENMFREKGTRISNKMI